MSRRDTEVNYFASMTDVMVGILFVFVIMVGYFAFQITSEDSVPASVYDPLVKQRDELQTKVSQLDLRIEAQDKRIKDLSQPDPVASYISDGIEARNQMIRDIVLGLRKQDISAEPIYSRGVITLSGQGLFARGSSDLESLPGARERVNHLGDLLIQRIRCYVKGGFAADQTDRYRLCNPRLLFLEAVFIEGHTDNRPVPEGVVLADGSRNNLELSSRRATNTYQALVSHRPEAIGFKNPADQQVLSVAAYGEQRPIEPGDSELARQKNRRIDIRFVMYVPANQQALNALRREFGVEP
ncbi:MAG: OmpA/MotB family protein [Gammaproteobacteria bacterium]